MSEQEKEKKVETRVVTRRVKKPKNPIVESLETIISGVFFDNVLPAIQDMFYDSVTEGFGRVIYGGEPEVAERRYSRGHRNSGKTNYNAIPRSRRAAQEGSKRIQKPQSDQLDDIYFSNRQEAEQVFDDLSALSEDYDVVRVSDFYSAAGVTPNQTDRYYGWTNLKGWSVRNSREGWYIQTTRPHRI